MRRFLGLPREHWIEKLSDLCSSPMSGWGPVLMCIHRWKRPRMRRRHLPTSSSVPKRVPRDLRTANRQDSASAADHFGGPSAPANKIFFSTPRKFRNDISGPRTARMLVKQLQDAPHTFYPGIVNAARADRRSKPQHAVAATPQITRDNYMSAQELWLAAAFWT